MPVANLIYICGIRIIIEDTGIRDKYRCNFLYRKWGVCWVVWKALRACYFGKKSFL